MRKVALVAIVVLVAAMPAFAQDKPVGFNFGGGWAFPVSGLRDAFDAGWNGSIGATFNINPYVGIQSEYMYDRLGGPDRTIPLFAAPVAVGGTSGILESNHQMHVLTFNMVYNPLGSEASSKPVGYYAIGGGGYYHRIIQLTTPSVGYTTFCDPYWYVCYPALVEVTRVIGDRSSNDFGINLGAGITFGTEAKFYVETRWHYVWGPKVTPTVATPVRSATTGEPIDCSAGCSTNAQYFPLTFGVRW
jgi:hypothetical protein